MNVLIKNRIYNTYLTRIPVMRWPSPVIEWTTAAACAHAGLHATELARCAGLREERKREYVANKLAFCVYERACVHARVVCLCVCDWLCFSKNFLHATHTHARTRTARTQTCARRHASTSATIAYHCQSSAIERWASLAGACWRTVFFQEFPPRVDSHPRAVALAPVQSHAAAQITGEGKEEYEQTTN